MPPRVFYDDLEHNDIRLLELVPANKQAQIECRLFKVAVSADPDYETISYVWGDPTDTETILCNNQAIEITVSLAQALRRFRPAHSEDSPRILWADAICINQENLLEKNTQVPLMRGINSVARRVVIWIGVEDEERAMTAVRVLEHMYFLCIQQSIEDPHFDEVNDPIRDVKLSALDAFIHEQGLRDVWQSLCCLFSVPNWSRVWCAQEVDLSGKTLFLIGPAEVIGDRVAMFTVWYLHRMLKDFRNHELPGDPLGMTIVERAHITLNYKDGQFSDDNLLCLTLDTFRDVHATDSRDKVYGLLSIHEQVHGKPTTIEVDYRKSTVQVYTTTALDIMVIHSNLHVLFYVDHGEEYDLFSEYPSWVPRWNWPRNVGQSRILSLTTSLSAGTKIQVFPLVPSKDLLVRSILFDYTFATNPRLGVLEHLDLDTNFVTVLTQLWVEVRTSRSKYAHQLSTEELVATPINGFQGISDSGIVMENFEPDIGCSIVDGFYSFLLMLKVPLSSCRDNPRSACLFLNLARYGCNLKRIFRTRRGYLGLGPACMREHDIVVVLDGGQVPYILRPLTDSTYAFMGECFVYAIRKGEAYGMIGKEGVKRQDFELH